MKPNPPLEARREHLAAQKDLLEKQIMQSLLKNCAEWILSLQEKHLEMDCYDDNIKKADMEQ